MNELFGNYEVNLDDPENEKTQKSEKAKLDLFTDVLPNIGSSNYDYYNQLTDKFGKNNIGEFVKFYMDINKNNITEDKTIDDKERQFELLKSGGIGFDI